YVSPVLGDFYHFVFSTRHVHSANCAPTFLHAVLSCLIHGGSPFGYVTQKRSSAVHVQSPVVGSMGHSIRRAHERAFFYTEILPAVRHLPSRMRKSKRTSAK
ncbi:unnamed protein product, partial [Ectocarpus sp. 12 AP-2014]